MSLKLSDFYKNYKNKYVFKNGAKLIKIWESHLNLYLKLKKFRYSKNFKKIELCDWIPSKNFENYFYKMYLEYENAKYYTDSFFDTPWHEYDELEYYN